MINNQNVEVILSQHVIQIFFVIYGFISQLINCDSAAFSLWSIQRNMKCCFDYKIKELVMSCWNPTSPTNYRIQLTLHQSLSVESDGL